MNIKCNAWHCKNNNNENNSCRLNDIELNFNWDREAYGCHCDNFEESKEYKRDKYLLNKIDDTTYLVTWKNELEHPDIKEVIKEKYETKNNIVTIIEDILIYKYSARDDERFYKYNVDLDKEDIVSKYETLNNKNRNNINPLILRYTCDYIRSLNTDEFGFLKKESVKMINKGIDL